LLHVGALWRNDYNNCTNFHSGSTKNSIFCHVLTDLFRDWDFGTAPTYQTDGRLFNLRRLHAKTEMTDPAPTTHG